MVLSFHFHTYFGRQFTIKLLKTDLVKTLHTVQKDTKPDVRLVHSKGIVVLAIFASVDLPKEKLL